MSPPPLPREKRQPQLRRGQVSERGDTTGTPDEVGQPPGQAARFGLLDVEGSGEEIVEGAIAHGHHRAREADDVVGHAEVWRRQVHQQRLRVEPHEVARTVRDWEPGGQEGWSCTAAAPAYLTTSPLGCAGPALSSKALQTFLSLQTFLTEEISDESSLCGPDGELPDSGRREGPCLAWLPPPQPSWSQPKGQPLGEARPDNMPDDSRQRLGPHHSLEHKAPSRLSALVGWGEAVLFTVALSEATGIR